jgi:hypothetical protein
MASTLGARDQMQAQAELLKMGAAILGNGALLAGFYFAWKNVHVLYEGQITERFTRSIEHLGSERLQVRLGGIYALGRIARDCKRDQHLILCVLCAFVREHARWEEGGAPHRLPCDVQAAMTVLGSRAWTRDPTRPWLDLSGVDLRGADLCWAHLEDANFTGSHLEGARFVDARLDRSYFTGAHVAGANFTGACLDHADLDGVIGLTEQQIQEAKVTPRTRLPQRGSSVRAVRDEACSL